MTIQVGAAAAARGSSPRRRETAQQFTRMHPLPSSIPDPGQVSDDSGASWRVFENVWPQASAYSVLVPIAATSSEGAPCRRHGRAASCVFVWRHGPSRRRH